MIDSSCALVLCEARKPDLPIIYCSDSFTLLTGYELPEILGHNCRFLQSRHGFAYADSAGDSTSGRDGAAALSNKSAAMKGSQSSGKEGGGRRGGGEKKRRRLGVTEDVCAEEESHSLDSSSDSDARRRSIILSKRSSFNQIPTTTTTTTTSSSKDQRPNTPAHSASTSPPIDSRLSMSATTSASATDDESETETAIQFQDAKIDALRQALRRGEEIQTTLVNFRKGGEKFINILTIVPIWWGNGPGGQGGSNGGDRPDYFVGFQIDKGTIKKSR
jgi:anti-sigma28 factor (negative regulator of flagellin synthesis)